MQAYSGKVLHVYAGSLQREKLLSFGDVVLETQLDPIGNLRFGGGVVRVRAAVG